jgi:DNA-binding transcriptional ArsR family regulator
MTETEIFRALADPTRRAVFERLAGGELNATQLREGLSISQPAMSQHVNYRVNSAGLAPLHDWLGRYRAFWPERIDSLKQVLREMDQ